jgi:hypothetical protein
VIAIALAGNDLVTEPDHDLREQFEPISSLVRDQDSKGPGFPWPGGPVASVLVTFSSGIRSCKLYGPAGASTPALERGHLVPNPALTY